jgi:hypothetical protein
VARGAIFRGRGPFGHGARVATPSRVLKYPPPKLPLQSDEPVLGELVGNGGVMRGPRGCFASLKGLFPVLGAHCATFRRTCPKVRMRTRLYAAMVIVKS